VELRRGGRRGEQLGVEARDDGVDVARAEHAQLPVDERRVGRERPRFVREPLRLVGVADDRAKLARREELCRAADAVDDVSRLLLQPNGAIAQRRDGLFVEPLGGGPLVLDRRDGRRRDRRELRRLEVADLLDLRRHAVQPRGLDLRRGRVLRQRLRRHDVVDRRRGLVLGSRLFGHRARVHPRHVAGARRFGERVEHLAFAHVVVIGRRGALLDVGVARLDVRGARHHALVVVLDAEALSGRRLLDHHVDGLVLLLDRRLSDLGSREELAEAAAAAAGRGARRHGRRRRQLRLPDERRRCRPRRADRRRGADRQRRAGRRRRELRGGRIGGLHRRPVERLLLRRPFLFLLVDLGLEGLLVPLGEGRVPVELVEG
jgi:hypothetical protein